MVRTVPVPLSNTSCVGGLGTTGQWRERGSREGRREGGCGGEKEEEKEKEEERDKAKE